MIRLLIIDQSLRDLNGHHFEYNISVASAARNLGLVPTIAANVNCGAVFTGYPFVIKRHFRTAWCDVHKSYPHHMARIALSGLPAVLRAPLISVGSRVRNGPRRQGRAVTTPCRPASFGAELSSLIQVENLAPMDHVLVHTLCAAELHALIAALANRDQLPTVHIVLRRDAEEAEMQSERWGGIGNVLALARDNKRLRKRLRFYSDTEHLCRQYEALVGANFIGLLPIPHHLPPQYPPVGDRTVMPVCAAYLGNARTEKGFHYLPSAVAALCGSHLKTNRLRFFVQANASMGLEEPEITAARRRLEVYGPDKVELIDAVLNITDFQRRMFEADIVLLPYRAENYRRRSSGILVQALIAGRPVVVPGGTWLSDSVRPNAAITFNGPDDLPAAIATAVEQLPQLTKAAATAAPKWRKRHNGEALVRCLLSPP